MLTCIFISPNIKTIETFLEYCNDICLIKRFIIFDGNKYLKRRFPKMEMIYDNTKYIKQNIFTEYSIIIKGNVSFYKTFFLKTFKHYQPFNNFINYEFVEIGTSNFSTCIQDVVGNINTKGLSVEPIKEYLDDLPNHPCVEKVCKAVSDYDGTATVYALPKHIVETKYQDKIWLRGCNSLFDYHPLHKKLNIEKDVVKTDIQVTSIEKLWKDFNIGNIRYFQTDCEGHDLVIMKALHKLLSENIKLPRPTKIRFESNEYSSYEKVSEIIKLFENLGYIVKHRGDDTLMEYSIIYTTVNCFIKTEFIDTFLTGIGNNLLLETDD